MNVYIPGTGLATQGPAPDGFHVPLSTEWQAIFDAGASLGAWSSSNGVNFATYLKIPMAGVRSFSNLNFTNVGSIGRYWSSSPNGTRAYYLAFGDGYVLPKDYGNRSDGNTVRCFKNSYVVPTSSWTKLYGTSIESGGIFHNVTDGLISVSSDGTNWITIADKNLGATTVYNYGDVITEANRGKVYQRGNNYAFSGDENYDVSQISQSSTQVDVTGYGPGNYYNSSTWITKSARQSSANDGNNLRGGVDGNVNVTTMKELKNAYIGEVFEYSYNFIGKTISQIANDGWQGTSGWTNTSDGIYRNSWSNPLSLSPSGLGTALSNAKKVTMNIGVYVTKGTGVRDLACRVTNSGQTASYFGLYFGGGSGDNSAEPGNSFTYTYNGTTVFTLVYDLVNKSLNITSTDGTSKSPSSFSLTDSYIASIVNGSQIIIKQNGTEDKMQSVSITIEY